MSAHGIATAPPTADAPPDALDPPEMSDEMAAALARERNLPPPPNNPEARRLSPQELISQVLFGRPSTTPLGTVTQEQVHGAAHMAADSMMPTPPVGALIVEQLSGLRNRHPDLDDDVMKVYHLTTFLAEYTGRIITNREAKITNLTVLCTQLQAEVKWLKTKLESAPAAPAEDPRLGARQLAKEQARGDEAARKLRRLEGELERVRDDASRFAAENQVLHQRLGHAHEHEAAAVNSLTAANRDLTGEYIRMQTYARHLEVELNYARHALAQTPGAMQPAPAAAPGPMPDQPFAPRASNGGVGEGAAPRSGPPPPGGAPVVLAGPPAPGPPPPGPYAAPPGAWTQATLPAATPGVLPPHPGAHPQGSNQNYNVNGAPPPHPAPQPYGLPPPSALQDSVPGAAQAPQGLVAALVAAGGPAGPGGPGAP